MITHDLGLVAEHADRVAAIYAVRVVETRSAGTLIAAPLHPYRAPSSRRARAS